MGGCNSDDRADTPRKTESWNVIVRRRVRLLVRNDVRDGRTVNRTREAGETQAGTERNNENPIDAASAPAYCKPKTIFGKAGALHKSEVAFQES